MEKISSKRVWTGKLFDVVVDKIKLDNVFERQYIETNFEAVVVLAITDSNEVVLVRQFRSAANEVLVEVPAGKTEPMEAIEQAAFRELEEESGYRAGKLEYMGHAFASPGISSEMYHFFLATQLVKGDPNPDDDEDTEAFLMPFEEFVEAINCDRIRDAKTIAATGLYLMRRK